MAERNVFSVDVEDYFHVEAFADVVDRQQWDSYACRVEANTQRLLDLLDECQVEGTFFVLGWVAERYPHLVRDIVGRGHEVACHSYWHRLIYKLTREEFAADTRRAKDAIEQAAGESVFGYRAPSYSITSRSLWALDILIEEGYWYDSSIYPIRHDRYGIPVSPREPFCVQRTAGPLMEVPGSTVRLGPLNLPVGGGGYFRILPYEWTRRGIAYLNQKEKRSAVFYLHPWEIDPGQPRLAAGWLGRFRHYRHLAETEGRLRRLLTDFSFGTIGALLSTRARVTATGELIPLTLPYVW